ncbi:competence type IV pilus major pilin ComGC [Niallia sp. Krafla_26]|uniref:competence type IV pilus major pilin ComGC n=1 Tax=Niallia sp. Krafla_26 TaxID=3064703 RepID=UPI003D1648E6
MLKKQAGFTLIEMMIVLMVISILLLITVPNVTKNNSSINKKGCEAYLKMVQSQVQAYQMENGNQTPTVELLKQNQYISTTTCPSGETIVIVDGTVQLEQ